MSKNLAKVAFSDNIFELYVLPLKDWISQRFWGGLGPSCESQSS